MTHKTKECLSRPRKAGAKWTGKDIQADEVVSDIKLGWDAKRDRWNGYDAAEYSNVVAEYEELEAAKKAAKASSALNEPQLDDSSASTPAPTGDDDNEETRYAEETDMGRNQPTSTRQLRLREDTAKYLLNLDLDSARYDPKTRSMDIAPTNTDDAEDGFVRPTLEGDAANFERAQRYAWETQEGNSSGAATAAVKKLHLQANPTEGEILLKQQTLLAAEKRAARQAYLESQYGNTALKPDDTVKALLTASNSTFVEYDDSGAIKGSKNKIVGIPKSKYPEDIYPSNHTSTFGSWWSNFQWGYACCHSLVRNSYCTGEEGKRAFEEAERLKGGELLLEDGKEEDLQQRNVDEDGYTGKQQDEHTKENPPIASEKGGEKGARKRTAKELRDGITEEEMEGYKRSRVDASDPMAKMLGKDELAE